MIRALLPMLAVLGGVCLDLARAAGVGECVTVQPIVVRGDDGKGAARCRIEQRLVDAVLAKAGVDFCFLDPIYYDDAAARDGKISLNEIVVDARKVGMIKAPGELINMFFVEAVDGRPGPLGRSRMPGWIAFVAMGGQPDKGRDAFVVAHEAGHNLGLRHADDDPNVPHDVSNSMGQGPLIERVGADGLTDYQAGVVRKSPLVRRRIECLDVERASKAILDESYEPYFAKLQRREIGALTGKAVAGATLAECRQQARRRFQDAVLPFTGQEEEALTWLVGELHELLADDFPLYAKQPWRFIKTDDRLCAGFSHTRGFCIILSRRTVGHIVLARGRGDAGAALRTLGGLLAHEQMHVLQRFYPRRFAELYRDVFRFEQARVEQNPWLVQRQMGNPDAPWPEWIVRLADEGGGHGHWQMQTLLCGESAVPRMGRDFMDVAVKVVKDDRGGYTVIVDEEGEPVHRPLSECSEYVDRFPTSRGLDHPNEIAAYMFGQLLREEYLSAEGDQRKAGPMRNAFRRWCREYLR